MHTKETIMVPQWRKLTEGHRNNTRSRASAAAQAGRHFRLAARSPTCFYLDQDLDVHQRVGQDRQPRAQHHLTTRVRHLWRGIQAREEVVRGDLPLHGAVGVLFRPFTTAI